ncbi:hypothetical protein EG329_008506 [Mollisiaceae sp. DMI_Dod_QoI]|nr:hypothetical protein EG329_008506 [Helotiales sp. DMI_Dod_QoI]
MAGCEPPHLPVVIAAVKAIAQPGFPLNGLAGLTAAHSTMLIVNGPLSRQLRINNGYPGIADLDYLGAGNKFSLCFAESEEANPWEPLHVERGFPRETSTVSAIAVDSQSEGRSASPLPELILRAIAGAIATPTTTGSTIWMETKVANSPVIALSSTHAKALAEAGWEKRDIKQFLYYHSRQWLNGAPDNTLVPIATSPDAFQIVVVNGEGPKSEVFTGIPGIVTVAV